MKLTCGALARVKSAPARVASERSTRASLRVVEARAGQVGLRQHRAREVDAAASSASDELRRAEVRARELGGEEVGAGQVGARQDGAGEVGAAELRAAEVGALEQRALEVGLGEVEPGEVGAGEIAAGEALAGAVARGDLCADAGRRVAVEPGRRGEVVGELPVGVRASAAPLSRSRPSRLGSASAASTSGAPDPAPLSPAARDSFSCASSRRRRELRRPPDLRLGVAHHLVVVEPPRGAHRARLLLGLGLLLLGLRLGLSASAVARSTTPGRSSRSGGGSSGGSGGTRLGSSPIAIMRCFAFSCSSSARRRMFFWSSPSVATSASISATSSAGASAAPLERRHEIAVPEGEQGALLLVEPLREHLAVVLHRLLLAQVLAAEDEVQDVGPVVLRDLDHAVEDERPRARRAGRAGPCRAASGSRGTPRRRRVFCVTNARARTPGRRPSIRAFSGCMYSTVNGSSPWKYPAICWSSGAAFQMLQSMSLAKPGKRSLSHAASYVPTLEKRCGQVKSYGAEARGRRPVAGRADEALRVLDVGQEVDLAVRRRAPAPAPSRAGSARTPRPRTPAPR